MTHAEGRSTHDLRSAREKTPPKLIRDFETALNSFVMILRIDHQGLIREANDLFCRTSGFHRDELINQNYELIRSDFHPPEFYEMIAEHISHGDPWRGHVRRRKKNGSSYWVDCTIAPIYNSEGLFQEVAVFAFDITREKETELQFRLAQNVANIGSWSIAFKDQSINWSDQMYDVFGFSIGDGIPSLEKILQAIHPEDRSLVVANMEGCRANGRPYSSRYRLARNENSDSEKAAPPLHRWVESHGDAVYNESGQIVGLFGVCQDITRSAELEADLKNAKSYLQAILDHMPAVVYSKSPDGRFLLVNNKFYEAVPYAQNVVGLYYKDFMPTQTAAEHTANDEEVLRTGRHIHVVESVQQPDGSLRYFDSYKFPIRDQRGAIMAVNGVSIDITDRKRAQEELDRERGIAQHQLRLASIGELAAGVGHEINNPLTIVMSYLTQIEKQLQDPHFDPRRSLEMIHKTLRAGERIAHIVGGLRSFARVSDEKKTFPLFRAVSNSVSLVKGIFAKEGVQIEVKMPKEPVFIFGDEGQIQQVIMNLLSNARDAVLEQSEKIIQLEIFSRRESALVSVRDSGVGISPRVRSRIFDPFFTTKPVLKGTGLGLSIAQSIVRDHGGRICCETPTTGGTVFELVFPLAAADENEPAIESCANVVSPSEKIQPSSLGRILVADDEEDIVEILSMTLESIGFEVEGAGNGYEAFQKLSERHFDVLMTDMNMPQLKGDALVRKIREELKLKDLKIFVITGGINLNLNDQDSTLQGLIDGHFYKPFDQQVLKSTLFSALRL